MTFVLVISFKMPATIIVGILKLITRTDFMLIELSLKKSFIASGAGLSMNCLYVIKAAFIMFYCSFLQKAA